MSLFICFSFCETYCTLSLNIDKKKELEQEKKSIR